MRFFPLGEFWRPFADSWCWSLRNIFFLTLPWLGLPKKSWWSCSLPLYQDSVSLLILHSCEVKLTVKRNALYFYIFSLAGHPASTELLWCWYDCLWHYCVFISYSLCYSFLGLRYSHRECWRRANTHRSFGFTAGVRRFEICKSGVYLPSHGNIRWTSAPLNAWKSLVFFYA